jgi:hypothetical protein
LTVFGRFTHRLALANKIQNELTTVGFSSYNYLAKTFQGKQQQAGGLLVKREENTLDAKVESS